MTENDPFITLTICILSFLIGSIPTGLIVSRSKGIDIRKVGSGNIGATNVLRALGKEAALITLIGDLSKGILPVALANLTVNAIGLQNQNYPINLFGLSYIANSKVLIQGLAGFSAILGHDFSIFLRFKGGKGVATSLGFVLAYAPHAGLMTATAWLLTARWTRFSSLSALVAFALSPLFVYMIDPIPEKIIPVAAAALLIFIRHKDNIIRLIRGAEDKIGSKGRRNK